MVEPPNPSPEGVRRVADTKANRVAFWSCLYGMGVVFLVFLLFRVFFLLLTFKVGPIEDFGSYLPLFAIVIVTEFICGAVLVKRYHASPEWMAAGAILGFAIGGHESALWVNTAFPG